MDTKGQVIPDPGRSKGKELEVMAEIMASRVWDPEPRGLPGIIDAVSYTHLDVYKRQFMPLALSAVFTMKTWGL